MVAAEVGQGRGQCYGQACQGWGTCWGKGRVSVRALSLNLKVGPVIRTFRAAELQADGWRTRLDCGEGHGCCLDGRMRLCGGPTPMPQLRLWLHRKLDKASVLSPPAHVGMKLRLNLRRRLVM